MRDKTKGEALNDAQKRAVEHDKGPLMVVAGAGTGKTRVIVERILRLIEKGVDPNAILALTFTEKAAGEMLDRINESRGGFTLDVTVATYNGFGDELLRDYAAEIGLGSLKLLGEAGQLVFLREHFDSFGLEYFAPVSRPDSQLKILSEYMSHLKQHLVTPEEYLAFTEKMPRSSEEESMEKTKHRELAGFYDTYIRLCREHNVIDYDDQLFLSIELLNKRPNIKKRLQEKYKYVLVDEFQDTNPMQSELLGLLTGKQRNLMVVGDDDQSIYGWRGATLANILGFRSRYPDTEQITLIENYRSTQSILDSAYRLIQNNNPERLEVMDSLDKRLKSHSGKGESPVVTRFSQLDNELAWVTEQILARLKKGQDPNTIAILARRNQVVQKMHEYLELYDVPHAVAGISSDLYEQVAVNQLIEALKAVYDPLDDLALFHVLTGLLFGINMKDVSEFSALGRREHSSLNKIIQDSGHEAHKALERIEAWRVSSSELSIGNLAYKIISDSGWKDDLYKRAEHDVDTAMQVQALSQFFKILKEFERVSGIASLQSFLQNLPTLKAAGTELRDASLEISDTLVNVLSVHRAKGLEWQTVFIIDCTEGSFPMRSHGGSLTIPAGLAPENAADSHLAEERRLMYVAVTRARSELYLTHSDTHASSTIRRPSRFLSELSGRKEESQVTNSESQHATVELYGAANVKSSVPLPDHMKRDDKILLSVSQVDCWLRCPQDFYYRYVLDIPLPPDPARAYGTAIHAVIESIHEGLRAGKMPDVEELMQLAQDLLPTQGYFTAATRDRSHEQAKKSIQKLHDRFKSEPLPREIEKAFRIEIPGTALVLKGRIDAVYDNGGGVEIKDYKTGLSVSSADQAKKRAQASTQLSLYALAWKTMRDEMPALLTLDFVETGQQGSVKKMEKSLTTLTTKLKDMTDKLLSSTYPLGQDHTYCKHPL